MRTYKRLDLTDTELKELLYIVKRSVEELGETIQENLQEKLNNAKEITVSNKKIVATAEATDSKKRKSVKKIKLVLEYMERNNKKMTYSAIAKNAEISPITVKKYINIINGKAVPNRDYYLSK